MGYIAHHTVVVEGYIGSDPPSGTELKKAHRLARKLCSRVSPITKPAVNGSQAFFVAPDGSKKGWGDSQNGDSARNELISYLKTTSLDWVEVRFGGDEPSKARVTRCDGWD